MKKKFLAVLLIPVLAVSLTMTACNVNQFEAVLNEIGPAVATIIQIIALVKGVPANTAPATKVSADVAAVEKLYNDYEKADATAVPGIRAEIQTGFTVLNGDLSTIFAVAQVSNANTQAKITALIGLVETAVQIAEAAVPGVTPPTAQAQPIGMDAKNLKSTFNSILVAKTGVQALDSWTPKHKL
jgi:uncharacterized protein YqgV (UPF0045/DUF77 family)